LNAVFGSGCVAGIVNCTKGGGDDVTTAVSFLKTLKPHHYLELSPNGRLLKCSVSTPARQVNLWGYNSANPTHNPGQYDLWVDLLVDGKTNRISNWSDTRQVVYDP
jgi:hypothetical protein